MNDRQFVQNKVNRHTTYRQVGGSHYRGITLTPSQFQEMDKAIERYGTKHFVTSLGNGIFFAHLRNDSYTLSKRSKKNHNVDAAFFSFDQPTWSCYVKEAHAQIKSLLHNEPQD